MEFDPEKIVLDEEEQWIEDHLDEFAPAPEWVGKGLREAAHNAMEEIRAGREKKPVTINLDMGAVSYFKSLAYDHFITDDTWDGTPYDKDRVNRFDRSLMHAYDDTLDTAGNVLVAGAVALPFLYAEVGLYQAYTPADMLTQAVMFAEAMALSHSVAHIVKGLVLRTRPYMYYATDTTPESDWNRSFYSGHSTMAFAAATFVSYTYWQYFSESAWKIPLAVTSYALAGATALVRVRAGCHFATDVLVGAVAGTAIGFCIPLLHKQSTQTTRLALLPNGVCITHRL